MNAETVELLKKVQDRKGEWRVLDCCWHLKFKDGFGVVLGIGKGSVLLIYFRGMDHHAYCEPDDPALLWLPPTAPRWPGDDIKRTLWGMVQWGKYDITVHHDGKVSVWRWPGHGETGTLTTSKGRPLPEALLRAR